MDIKKIDIKKKLVAGTALAVMSGFIPPVVNQAQAGTATMPVTVQIVTAINLAGTSALDFGRLAVTGAATGNHTLSPAGVTTTGPGLSVAVAGSPGGFNITAGSGAANVNVIYGPAVTYNGGNISLDQLTLAGVGFVAPVVVGAGASVTGNLAGGGNPTVDIGGRLNITATPTNGNFTGTSATINVVDIP